jgi:hypothetical protein
LKLANGVFARKNGLPSDVVGEFQRPDYLWPVRHTYEGDCWSVGLSNTLRIWCDCVGEGKPTKVPEENENDHALNQVVMSAVSCIYFQISLDRSNPQVLAFTLNRNMIRFFVVTAQRHESTWQVSYLYLKYKPRCNWFQRRHISMSRIET